MAKTLHSGGQRSLHVQGDAGHPGGGPDKEKLKNWKKWRAKEMERH
jgi:hypothetical protein